MDSNQHKDLGLHKNKATLSHEVDPTPKVIKSKVLILTYDPPLPFSSRLAKSEKEENQKEILNTFRKVHVNKKLSHYVNYLKEICINKCKLKGIEVVIVCVTKEDSAEV